MKKTILLMISLVMIVATVMIAGPGCAEKPIKIGAILSITGAGDYMGEDVRDGMLLAVDDVNSQGGINGRKIELIIEDSKTDPEEGKKVFSKMESEHHPDMYVSMLSLNCVALAPLAEENEVMLLGLCVTVPEFTEEKEWVFRYWVMTDDEVSPVLSMLEESGVKNLGIMYSNEEYGISVFGFLKEEFEKTGGKVKSEALEMDEADYKEKVTKLKDMEAIYIVGYGHHYENVYKQLREIDYQGHILGASGACKPSLVSMPESNGVYVAAPKIYDPDFLFAEEVKDEYESIYGRSFTHFAANGYDAVKILAELLEDKEVSRRGVRDVLKAGFIHPGVLGTVYIEPNNHDISFPLYPARIIDGEVKFRY
ncbi:ABC transporter substrate-binding protein [Chloroflexota bacterium]